MSTDVLNMFFKRKNEAKQKSNVSIAIDIGTHAVKTIVYKREGRETTILGFATLQQPSNAMDKALILNTEYVTDTVDKSIGQAIQSAKSKDENMVVPKSAIIGIAGELITGMPVTVNIERDDVEEDISVEELEQVIRNVKEHTFKSTLEDIAEEILMQPNQIQEVDTYIDSIKVDGTKVSNPIGLRGTELSLKVYATFAPKVQFDSIKKVMQDLNLKVQRLVVEPYAIAASYGGIRRDSEGTIFVDIGGGTTDVAIINSGEIVGTKMYGVGGRVFTERVMREEHMNFEDAEYRKVQYCEGKLEEKERNIVREYLRPDVAVWLTGLELALEEFNEIDSLPPNILLCGGGSLMPDIMEAMLEYPWKQKFPFRIHPKIHYYYPNKVNGVIDSTRSLQNPEDVTPITLIRSGIDY